MAVVLFYGLAFCFTVAAWLKTIVHLLGGHFTRAAIWLSIGCGMMFWWQGTEVIPHPWDFAIGKPLEGFLPFLWR
jgi:hypothetical protein